MSTRGYTLMADVVIALAAEPMTANQISERFAGRVGQGPMLRLLRRLLDGRVLRISGWVGTRNMARIYSVGSEPSVPAPVFKRKNGTAPSPVRIPTKPATPMHFPDQFCAIWRALETPCTVAEICEEIGVSNLTIVRNLLHRFRKAEPKLVRIAGYERTAHRAVLFERSSMKDAKRPGPLSERHHYLQQKQRAKAMDLHRALSFFPIAEAA